MQVWKRRLAFVLAVGTGTLGLTLPTASAQTSPPDFPTFPTFPTFPEFPSFPTSTPPPPTMPPPTSPPSTSPPPTMPPPTFPPFPTIPVPPTMPPSTSPPTSTPPPTMPPTSSPPTTIGFPSFQDQVEEIFEELLSGADENTREFLELIQKEFFS